MEIKDLTFKYNDEHIIFENLNLSIAKNKITTIIGSNGSGKSTLLKILSKQLKVNNNMLFLDQIDINDYLLSEFAKKLAIVFQKNEVPREISVHQLISYGQIPYQKIDYEYIDEIINECHLTNIKDEIVTNLSGGQMQLVWIAMAIVQRTPYLLLDEPTTYLDIKRQKEILNLIQNIQNKYEITIIMVLHDLNQALNYSDELICLKKGRVIAQNTPTKLFKEKVFDECFDTNFTYINIENQNYIL